MVENLLRLTGILTTAAGWVVTIWKLGVEDSSTKIEIYVSSFLGLTFAGVFILLYVYLKPLLNLFMYVTSLLVWPVYFLGIIYGISFASRVLLKQ